MLRWQPRKQHKRVLIYAPFVTGSVILHLIFCFSLLFVYKGDFFRYQIEMTSMLQDPDVQVLFVPLQKRVAQKATLEQVRKGSALGKTSGQRKKEGTGLADRVSAKKVAKKPKKITQQKKEPALSRAQNAPEPMPKNEALAPVEQTAAQGEQVQHVVEVGRVEMEALELQREVSYELSKQWRLPAGMAPDCECVITLCVDLQGKVQQLQMGRSSGVPVYDISARTAALALQLPKLAWGKEFTITFKQ